MKTTHHRNYDGIPIGMAVRGSLADLWTYRVRPGNGHYNAVLGEVYQDCYTYFVPTSITNAEGAAARLAFATAVSNWQGLPLTTKDVYDTRARKKGNVMSGYNLFIKEYVEVNA